MSIPFNIEKSLTERKYLPNQNISKLKELLLPGNQFRIPTLKELSDFDQLQISQFCLEHAIYQLPTIELIEFLKSEIGDMPAIEIGAGRGYIGKGLNIPITDNCQQNWEGIKAHYKLFRQPTITYPTDIIELDAISAINKYNPQVAIGSWVTQKYEDYMQNYQDVQANQFGVNEFELLRKVKKYIHIGNEESHDKKEILRKYKVKRIYADWLVSRATNRTQNVIYIFRGLA